MDRMIYTAMSGAKQAMEQQASVANNMANVSTAGFKAQINNFRAVPVVGDQPVTRAMVVATTPGADFSPGVMTQTGRPLDVAVKGDGWLAVQLPGGAEAYTRVGNLQVGAEGQLMTLDSYPVLGNAGPVVVPPGSKLVVAGDGLITAFDPNGGAVGGAEVGRLKLVNPARADLLRGEDGLFRTKPDAAPAQVDPAVRLSVGTLEGSNVNSVEVMVQMITNARLYEMQMKTIQTAETNDQQANRLLSTS
ncbi:Flagellar basal-body rod protein FlgF [Polaromonas vacuolata]|uniref:Flagellar basal-body rod protein FlgF n=1 Tax=Polaromonas vacuolata TaxID=37448 RepID=A0A6H2H5L0_9BURK|nr:flagellar basal-body rod protein FlgF [Polaromonas vacuolata]QJC55138.1 Flagellar basal-body rod protein FlgF [Polaromonas vacuolata]